MLQYYFPICRVVCTTRVYYVRNSSYDNLLNYSFVKLLIEKLDLLKKKLIF